MLRASALVLSLLFVPVPAGAQASVAGPCALGQGSALAEISCELTRGLGPRAEGALVAAVVPTTDPKVTVRPELATRLAALLAGAMGKGATAWPAAEGPGRVRSLAQGSRPLVVVTTRIAESRIEVSADAYVGREKLWRRIRRGSSGPMAHAFAARALDAETRTFLPAVPLVAREIVKARGGDADTVAIACGDMDGDGAPELALLGRRRVSLSRVRAGTLVTVAERALGELSPVAGKPLREPIAAAWIPSTGVLELGLTDRAFGLRLDARLQKIAALDSRVPWPGGGCAADSVLSVGPALERCLPTEAAPQSAGRTEPVDALAGARIVTRDGRLEVVRAGRALGTTKVVVTVGRRSEILEPAGAQLALGDLDGDGLSEIVSSLDTREPSTDAIVVHSLGTGHGLVKRFSVPVPSGVRALAVCPLRAAGMAPIAAMTGDGVWVIR
jgi:hypothetical protein